MQAAAKGVASTTPPALPTSIHQFIQVYVWTLTYLKPYKWQVLLLIGYAVIITIGEMAFPKFIAYIIDYAAPQKKCCTVSQRHFSSARCDGCHVCDEGTSESAGAICSGESKS